MEIPKTKKGRAGDLIARDIAKRYVELYEEAAKEPDGKSWIEVEFEGTGEKELMMFVDSNDPKPLIEILRQFSETGYFEGELQDKVRFTSQSIMFDEYNSIMKSKTKNYHAVIDALSKKYNISRKTVERRITTYRKILGPSNQDAD